MRFIATAGLAALLAAAPAFAEPVTRTVTVDTPRYEGSRTITRDREAGTLARDSELTRRSDDAVAARSFDRQRTETGAELSGSTTRFDGATRSFEVTRERTGRGFRSTGTINGFDGQSYDYRGGLRRTPNGFVRRQAARDGEGDLVAGRRVAVRRGPLGSHRRMTRLRPRG